MTTSSYTIKLNATITCAYKLTLSKANAKAICADWIDPDEKWDDQADTTLETAFDSLLDDPLQARLTECLPATVDAVIEGKQVQLKLMPSEVDFDSDGVEVQ